MNLQVAEVKMTYKTKTKASERPLIVSSRGTYDLLMQLYDMDTIEYRESMKLILLNQANKVLGYYDLSVGGIDGTYCDVRNIMQIALLSNATGIILSHNHPSGNTQPSQQDKGLTAAIEEACKVMKILLVDHLIVSKEGYFSFADNHMI